MGNIRAAIALYDGVTSPLQSMHKAMGVVLNTFEAMQQASGRAVDTAAIPRQPRHLKRLTAANSGPADGEESPKRKKPPKSP